jgi:hypothetical protein
MDEKYCMENFTLRVIYDILDGDDGITLKWNIGKDREDENCTELFRRLQ